MVQEAGGCRCRIQPSRSDSMAQNSINAKRPNLSKRIAIAIYVVLSVGTVSMIMWRIIASLL